MNAERRNHHHRDYGKIQKHDGRLTPGVLPKAPLASESRAKQKTYSHSKFEDKNNIGAKWGGRFKKCFYQSIVSTQTAARVLLIFRRESRFAEWRNSSWRNLSQALGTASVVAVQRGSAAYEELIIRPTVIF